MGANSTVTGVVNGAAGSTFQTGDIINGNATSNATITVAAANANTLVEINALNTITFRNLADTTGANAFNAQLFSNVGTVASTGSNNRLGINNGALASTYSLSSSIAGAIDGIDAGIRAGDLTGTSNTINFSVNNVGTAAVARTNGAASSSRLDTTVSGIETIAVTTAGTNTFTVTANTAATTDSGTLTITGAGNNTITVAALATTSNINASAATGPNTINVGGGLTSNDTVTGGTGADTLRATTAGAATGVRVSGIETLRVSEGSTGNVIFAAAPNFSTIRVDSSALGAASNTNALFNTVGSTASISYIGDSSAVAANTAANGVFGALTLNTSYTGSADTVVLSVNNGGVAKDAGVGFGTGVLTANGIETLNVTVANVTATGAYTPLGFTSSTLQAISFTTPGTLQLAAGGITGNGTAATATVNSISFAGVTGAVTQAGAQSVLFANGSVVTAGNGGTTLTFTANQAAGTYTFVGGTGADIVTFNLAGAAAAIAVMNGGGGNDSLTGGAGADILSGGDGNDTITGGAANDNLTGGTSADDFVFADTAANNGNDIITDFSVAEVDQLNFLAFMTTFRSAQDIDAVTNATGDAALTNDHIMNVNFAGNISGVNFGGAGFASLFGTAVYLSSDALTATDTVTVLVRGNDQTQVLFVATGDTAAIAATDVIQVATLNGVNNATVFGAANFIGV